MRKITLLSLALVSLTCNAFAQDGVDIIDSDPLDTDLSLESLTEVPKLEPNLDGEYSSKPVGKRKRWQLDNGEFDLDSTTPKPRRESGDTDRYSGFRFRLPIGKQ